MASIQNLKDLGEQLGLKGAELKEFIKEQQERDEKNKQLEREERYKQREYEKSLQDAEERKRQYELEAEERKRRHELEAEDKKRQHELEAEEKKRQHQLEARQHEREESDSQRGYELERLRLEQQTLEMKLKLKAGFTQKENANESDREDNVDDQEDTILTSHSNVTKTAVKGPKMPCFEETKDDMDAYLHRFEVYAQSQGWKTDQWAVYLSALLKGRALEVYSRLPVKDAQNYDTLKDALLRRFNLTEEGFKQKFKTAKPESNEAPSQFIARLESYLMRWIDLANVEKDFEGLKNLMIREQYLESCSVQLAIFLRERKTADLDELAKFAEQYMDAHTNKSVHRKQAIEDEEVPKDRSDRNRNVKPIAIKKCFNCGKAGHIAKNCFQMKKAAAMYQGRSYNVGRSQRYGGAANARTVQQNSNGENETETAIKVIATEPPRNVIKCKAHGQERCSICLDLPMHRCNALKGTEVELRCGCVVPVIADACQSRNEKMPVRDGMMGEHKISVLRDTGCSTVVVRRSLVSDEQLTGAEETCVLIDGTVRRTPVAEIEIDTPYYTGKIKAVCMRNPLYDVIVGNISGVKNEEEIYEVQAVMTRSQVQKQEKTQKPLKVMQELDGDITRDGLISMQQQDSSLKRFLEKAQMNDKSSDASDIYFKLKNGILYRYCKCDDGREISQVVVPVGLRDCVIKMAHDAVMSGHQGRKRTRDRIWREFWWPGLNADVTRFCRSCDICQRTIAKGRVANVPLGKMPIIDAPFDRVAVDIVGPIYPATERGNRYIVTMVDYATRYPEAVPVKDIHAETVAEALVNIFTRVGVPKEILSDQGSQFLSAVMKEMCRLLSLKQLVTTPYHPMCNGLVEKFNGTLKNMLRHMCAEKPRDWDRYIGPLLFAYREVRQESLGYSPFELLYGRTVRGPMCILRELLTNEAVEPEVKLTYEYVVDLKERLSDTCELAQKELQKSQVRQQKYYNRKTKVRTFEAGDDVLVLLPTDSNKLLLQWQGPFKVLEKVRGNDYRIQLSGRTKMYHANMLKKYWKRESSEVTSNNVVQEVSAVVVEAENGMESDANLYTDIQTETFRDVKINPELTEQQKMEVMELLEEFKDVFTDVPGLTTLGEHSITLTTEDPVHSKPYPIPHAMQEVVEKELETMLNLGIIEPSTSAYASPIVIVRKPDGTNRVCVDFRKLNKITVFDPEPMPQPDQIFAKLDQDRYFSTFDITKGYWQVPMSENDKAYTAFVTHKGLHQFTVMPFGLVNAPATFNRLMRKLLYNAKHLDNYVDDVLAHTPEWQHHLCAMRDFLTRIREAHLTLRPTKCAVGFYNVSYLGHCVGNSTLEPKADMVSKILQAPKPTDKKQLRSFLGLVGYYRKFIPNFAAIAVPLTDLVKKGTPNQLLWNEPQEMAFKSLKEYIANPPILHLPNFDKEFVLQTDASNEGVGAVLLQEDSGVKHPVAFISKKLLPRERNYSTIEKECLAIVWAVQKLQSFLYGKQFILETDHQPLQYLGKAQFQNGRLMRWALALQPYRFVIRSIKGSQNVGADFLSRHIN